MEDLSVLHWFQSKFEGICRIVLERLKKEQLYKFVRSTQQHQKQQIWGWIVISMKLESFRLSCNTMSWHKTAVKHAHSLKFIGWRSSHSKWLNLFLEIALAMSCNVAAWICMFLTLKILPNFCKKCSSICNFQQPDVHDIEYSRISKFLQFFQVKRGASMWSPNFLIEVTVKFRVLLAIPRNKARKSLRNPTSCPILRCAFDAKKSIEKENGRFRFFWGDLYPTTPSVYTIRFTFVHIDLPEEKFKNEHMLQGFFLEIDITYAVLPPLPFRNWFLHLWC